MSKYYYKKTDPAKTVTITNDSQPLYYELSDGQMIKKDIFSKYYDERDNVAPELVNESFTPRKSNDHLDPSTFFTTPSMQLNQNDIQSLKNADSSKGVADNAIRTEVILNTANKTKNAVPVLNEKARQPLKQPVQNESIIQEVDETKLPIPDHTNTDVSQYRVYENDDDAYNDLMNRQNNTQPVQQPPKQQVQPTKTDADQLYDDEKAVYGWEEADRRRNIRLKRANQPPMETQQQVVEQKKQEPPMNPSEMMFKTFKRNHDIKINVEFNDKIGNPEFIKLMMENMDGDIVGFYKNLIIEKIQNNFKLIEDEVEKQIRKEIFGYDEVDIEYKEVDLTKEVMDKLNPEVIQQLTKLSHQIIDKSHEITEQLDKLDDMDEEVERLTQLQEEISLIPGGKSSSGKQLYKYVDDKGKTKEVLPETAEKNGWKPLIK